MPKIVNNGDGCALMKDLKKGGKRYSCGSFRNRTSVSVKFRSGYDEKHINAVEFGVMCEEAGAKSITVHGRTKTQLYSGKADWNIIRAVTSAVSVPVFGNGDVFGPEDAKNMYEQTGLTVSPSAGERLAILFIFEQIKKLYTERQLFRI